MSQRERAERERTSRATTRWQGAFALVVDLPVRREAADRMLPEVLDLVEPPTASLVVASFPGNEVGPAFREVAVVFYVADVLGPARHCPWSVVDDFTAVVLGAEIFGVPRRMGRIAFAVAGDSLTAALWSSGTEVLRVKAALGPEQPGGDHVYGGRVISQSESMFAAPELVERSRFSETIRTTRKVCASMSIQDGADDLGALAALVVSDGAYGRLVTLDLGLSARDSGATDDAGATDNTGGSSEGDDATDATGDTTKGEGALESVPQIVFTGLGGASVMMPLYTTLG